MRPGQKPYFAGYRPYVLVSPAVYSYLFLQDILPDLGSFYLGLRGLYISLAERLVLLG